MRDLALVLPSRLGAALCCAGLTLAGCGRAGTEIVIQGSPTILPVVRPALAAYRPGRPPSAVLLTAGSTEALRSLLAGSCDIAALDRELTPAELRRARDAGADLRIFKLGYAAAVPIVHRQNPLTALTVPQLRDVWSGAIRNWREVGGPDLPIHVVTRADGSALADLWNEAVMAGAPVRADATFGAAPAAGEPDLLAALVGRDPAAIGYTSPGQAAAAKPLAVRGGTATAASGPPAQPGGSPLGSALWLVLDGRTATDTVQGFVDFLLEPDGQRLLRRAGYRSS
jgi:phosphate transport system substrate-binding protein